MVIAPGSDSAALRLQVSYTLYHSLNALTVQLIRRPLPSSQVSVPHCVVPCPTSCNKQVTSWTPVMLHSTQPAFRNTFSSHQLYVDGGNKPLLFKGMERLAIELRQDRWVLLT